MSEKLQTNSQLSHYRILSKLGAGGMGEVWLAEDTRLGRKVALKLLPAEFTEDSERVRRFTQEAKAASALNHPNIISVHDIGESETGRFIVMEFVAGCTLRSVIAKDNSLETLFTLGGQMAKALSAAHAAGITHRDIKPDNIMVRDDGYVKMLDFGLARLLPTTSSDPEAMTLAQQTTPGTVMGTLAYMSPEQATGQTVGSPSDVFALGIVLYELGTGSHPFKSESMIGYLHAITSQVPPSMTSLKSHLPVALDNLILRMLEKDARQRPTAGEAAQALQEIEKYGSSNTLPIRILAAKPSASTSEEGFWVAVLPFKYRGDNADIEALTDGLSEDILTGLSRFSYLRVIARGSTLPYANQTTDLRKVGKELGARYVMEGTLRHAGKRLRLAVQVVDATTGAHLWAENYEREFSPETIFELQDDLVPRIVSTVADWYGALPHSMSETVRLKPPDQLSPYEALLRSFGYFENIASEEHAIVRSSLERAVAQEPGNADLWAMLSMLFGEEHRFGFNVEPDSLGRSLGAARKAVAIAHANHFAWLALAQALFFRKELDAFRDAAERSIALNPMDGSTIEYLGHLIAFSGNWERGCELAERARQLNPNHPSWYWSVPFLDAYRKGDYPSARTFLTKGNPQKNYLMHALLAAVNGQLGESEAAARHLREVLTMMPDFPSIGRSEFSKWYLPDLVDHLMDGLRKAGLETTADEQKSKASPSLASSEIRADEGFWVAVLPFKFIGSNTEVATLADGLSEEIVTGLSRFSYLRVISRSSTLRYATETSDVRTVGNTLGARYVVEGSLRIAGTSLRVSVQLVDASTGAHLWVETYKRSINTDDIFELQDDLASRIVSTIADMNGVLPRTMGEMLRQRDASTLTPNEVVLRAFAYLERLNAEEHAEVRSALERAVKEAPNQADCLAMLAMVYVDEQKQGFNVLPDSLDRALAVARRAVAAAPSNHLAHAALAQILFFRRDLQGFRSAADRAVALNPMDAYTTAFMGILIAYSGDWDYGSALAEKGMELNPNHPGWYRFCSFFREYGRHEYRVALDIALRMNMPSYFYTHAALAAAYAQLGEMENARTSLRELLAQVPDFAAQARDLYQKWFGPGELLEDVLDGLRKAGLESSEADVPSSPTAISSETRADEGFWVAVLPFKATGTDAGLSTFAEGLSDEIVTGLNRFSYLRVIARSSTLRYASQTSDVRTLGKTLGARYVMEGNVRQAGSVIRVTVQLIDATTGAHLWAETYDRPFRSEDIFALQDDLVPRIVSTVADQHGVLPHTMSEVLRFRDPETLSPYEVVLRGFGYYERATAAEHAALRSALERAVEQAPGSADCWAMLSIMYCDEHKFDFNPLPDALGRALVSAQRAVEASASSPFAYEALAQALFFRREFNAFRNAAERAIALNPLDGATTAFMGMLMACTGDWEHGCAVAERATQLNPHHPGWYWGAAIWNAYRKGDYSDALGIALKFNMPGFFFHHLNLATVYGQLGEREAASKALRDLLALKPDFAANARDELGKFFDLELVEHMIDGLRKAGLEIGDASFAPSTSGALSSESRADEGFWIAVLPFKFTGSNTEVATLAEGLSEEIITGLSRFSYLRVISRSSTLRYANETDDVRAVGKTLGARYVMEGSLRLAGSSLRISVQLLDANSGAHLWAETYDRPLRAEDIFALQDDLVPRIVSTVADQYGALVHSMSESLRGRSAGQYSAHEAVLRAFGYWERMAPEEHAEVRDILEAAVDVAPDHSDCLAELAMIYWHEYAFGYNLKPDPIGRACAAGQRAVATAPTSHFAHCALATSLFFQKDFLAFRPAAERALALNTMDASTMEILGQMIAYAGDWDYGMSVVERAMQLNPHHPGWYHYLAFCDAYRKRDYRRALASALKVNMPAYHWPHVYLAAVYGQLGEHERARTALRDLDKLVPNFGAIARREFGKWLDAELTEHLIDGLRKAGLAIVDEESSSAQMLSGESRADEGFWIAVLPFKFTGSNTEVATLAEGMSEEIITGLSRFSYLRVISRSSTLRYANETDDVRSVGKTLGARYVMEGSLRVAGGSLRASVQLIDASTGAHVWAETYDRQFRAEEIFALQDELVPKIVATAADRHGVLQHSMSEALRNRDVNDLRPYELVLRGFTYYERATAAEHPLLRTALERAVEQEPGNGDCWAILAILYCDEYKFGLNPLPDSLGRALAAAQKAVEVAVSNSFAYDALAQAHFFRLEFESFRNAAARAIALNPLDGATVAWMGTLIAFSGDWDHGCDIVRRAMQLNPHHPGWYWHAIFWDAYRKANYRAALSIALKCNLPGLYYQHWMLAIGYGQLGEREAANKSLQDLLALRPDFATEVREECGKWFNPELVEHAIDGLRNAGLEIDGVTGRDGDGETGRRGDTVSGGSGDHDISESPRHPVTPSSTHPVTASPHLPLTASSSSHSSLIKSIAVLPFQNLSVDPEQEFFADGITEDILNALAQIKELRVAGRSSSFSFKGRNEDLRSVGTKLNVTCILEGTLRRSGDRLRITAQLIDAVSGYQLWSERYDRVLKDIFDIQDEIALAVVDALKLKLFGEAKEAVVKRYTDDAKVHELFLKARYYSYKYTAEGWTRAVEFFEKVIEKHPDHAAAHAGLAAAVGCLWFFGLSPADETVPTFRSAAIKAIELDGTLASAHLSLGMVNFFHDWEWEKAEQEFKLAILLNPKDAEALSYYAMFLGFVDRFDEAMELARRALAVDPLSLLINMNVGWTYFSAGLAHEAFEQTRKMTEIEPGFFGAYWLKGATCLENGDYEEAVEQLTKAVSLGAHPIVLADLGAAYALAGKKETAETILDQLLEMRRQSHVSAICLARVYSRLGELEKTIQWLETAYEERNGELVFLESEITSAAEGDSLNSLGKDPRVKDLLARMKLPSQEASRVQGE